jgi:hypothetical protein
VRDFLWHSPALLQILFSTDHGLLVWTPLLAFSFIGLFLIVIRSPKAGLPFFVATLLYYLFFALYPDWDGISSFGNRFFVSLTPLFILGLAIVLERSAAFFKEPRVAKLVAAAVLTCFAAWNLGLVYQLGTHLVPARGPISFRQAAYNQVAVVPRELFSHVHAYFFRRSDLMRQIERRDQEQLNEITKP